MKTIGILGTGTVGKTIGSALIKLGYEVKMGSRTASNTSAHEFALSNGPNASHGTFAETAQFADVLLNCTLGMASLQALELTGKENLKGKINANNITSKIGAAIFNSCQLVFCSFSFLAFNNLRV